MLRSETPDGHRLYFLIIVRKTYNTYPDVYVFNFHNPKQIITFDKGLVVHFDNTYDGIKN